MINPGALANMRRVSLLGLSCLVCVSCGVWEREPTHPPASQTFSLPPLFSFEGLATLTFGELPDRQHRALVIEQLLRALRASPPPTGTPTCAERSKFLENELGGSAELLKATAKVKRKETSRAEDGNGQQEETPSLFGAALSAMGVEGKPLSELFGTCKEDVLDQVDVIENSVVISFADPVPVYSPWGFQVASVTGVRFPLEQARQTSDEALKAAAKAAIAEVLEGSSQLEAVESFAAELALYAAPPCLEDVRDRLVAETVSGILIALVGDTVCRELWSARHETRLVACSLEDDPS